MLKQENENLDHEDKKVDEENKNESRQDQAHDSSSKDLRDTLMITGEEKCLPPINKTKSEEEIRREVKEKVTKLYDDEHFEKGVQIF